MFIKITKINLGKIDLGKLWEHIMDKFFERILMSRL